MKMTMQQIAQKLGVSRTTVSLVLKGDAAKYRINPDTARTIHDTVRTLQYTPDYLATALTAGKTKTIGVVFPNVFESFMSEVVKGIEDVLYPAGYMMILCTSRFDRNLEVRVIETLLHRGVDGLIVVFNAPFAGKPYDYSHLKKLASGSTPIVFVDRALPGVNAHSIVQDDRWAAAQATKHLIANGCRKPAYISLDIEISSIQARYQGFLDACAHAHIKHTHEVRLKRLDSDSNDLSTALQRIFKAENRPDGLLITTHGIALKTIGLLRNMGLNVPEDVQVAKFGSDPRYLPSGALCVKQPHVEMGTVSARLIVDACSRPSRLHKVIKRSIRPVIYDIAKEQV
jgi:LacI family transcriptional regulator